MKPRAKDRRVAKRRAKTRRRVERIEVYEREIKALTHNLAVTNATVQKTLDRDEEMILQLYDALIWCGGSADFAPDGQARKGWVKTVAPLLDRVAPWVKKARVRRCWRR